MNCELNIVIDPKRECECSPITRSCGFTKLMWLIKNMDICEQFFDIAKNIILHQPEEINETNTKGWTPLMIAVRNACNVKYVEMAKLLFEHGADVNACNEDGWTPLMLTVCDVSNLRCVEMAKLLIKHGAHVNVRNNDGWTILMIAMKYAPPTGLIVLLKLLLKHGADVNLKTSRGTVMNYLVMIKDPILREEVRSLLLDHGYIHEQQKSEDGYLSQLYKSIFTSDYEPIKKYE
jgi:ankyrin repeat protein